MDFPRYRKNASQSAKVNNAVRLGYTKTGKRSAMRRRKSNHLVRTVSRRATARQISHAGKNEPMMSKEGARAQLASRSGVRRVQYFTNWLVRLLVMVEVSSPSIELNPPFGKPD
jgi:hypothetical protein